MSSFGVLSSGFAKKTRAEIIEDIETRVKDDIDPNLNTEATSILGQIIGIVADQISQNWDVIEEVYYSNYPDSAEGASLDSVVSLIGLVRLAATNSTVTLLVTGTAATNIPANSQARVPSGGIFETTALAVLSAATAWAPTTAYALGDIVSNDSPANIYLCVTAGTSAGSGGPTGEGTAISDGTVAWRFVGDGAAYSEVEAQSIETGPVVGQSFQITEIVTAVSGWDSVTNQDDAALGRDLETDAELRVRQANSFTTTGKATLEAIRSALLQVSGVIDAIVFQNVTDVTDINGLPPHSVEAVIQGGSDAAIAQSLFDNVAAGVQTYGTDISEVVTDSQGINHTILASRSAPVEMFADITVTTDSDYPVDGDTQIEDAIIAFGDALSIGDDVLYKKIQCVAFDVPGVVDITSFFLDKRPVTVTSGNTETFALSDGMTLTVKVDGQSTEQTVTFNTGDFIDIANATAAEVAAVITADLNTPSATAADVAGAVAITSDSSGTIEVTGGTSNAVLGFPTSFTPTGTSNVTILNRQLATFNAARITVTS